MSETLQNRTPPWVLRILFLFLFGLILVYAVDTLLLVFAGALGALFLVRTSHWIGSRIPLSDKQSLVALLLILLAASAIFVLSIGPSLAQQVNQLGDEWPSLLQRVQERVKAYPVLDAAWTSLSKSSSDASQYIGRVQIIFSGVLGALSGLVLLVISTLYMAFQPAPYKRAFVLTLTRLFGSARGRRLSNEIAEHLWGFLIGQAQTMSILAIVTTIGLWFLGIPLYLALGVIAGLFAFVPVVGPIASVVPALVIALAESSTKALYVLILYGGIQLLESNLITPIVQKNSSELPPVLTLTVQGILGTLCGTLGLLVAAPLATVGMVAWEEWVGHEDEAAGQEDPADNQEDQAD